MDEPPSERPPPPPKVSHHLHKFEYSLGHSALITICLRIRV